MVALVVIALHTLRDFVAWWTLGGKREAMLAKAATEHQRAGGGHHALLSSPSGPLDGPALRSFAEHVEYEPHTPISPDSVVNDGSVTPGMAVADGSSSF